MPFEMAETALRSWVQWLKLFIEMTGAVIIGIGVCVALWQLARALIARRGTNFNAIRLVLARYLALALEFQLGADILSTAIAPTPEEIGQLAAIAVIRTGLNYFLMLEMREERTGTEEHVHKRAASGGESDNSGESSSDADFKKAANAENHEP